MRILYAANYSLKNCGERYDHVVLKLQQGFSTNGHYVYPFSINDMERLNLVRLVTDSCLRNI